MSVADQIAINAAADPGRCAIEVIGGETLTTADVWNRTVAVADVVGRATPGPHGRMVGILLPNGADHVIAYLACDAAGVAAVPVNNRLARPEIEFVLRDSGASMLLTDEPFLEVAGDVAAELGIEVLQISAIAPDPTATDRRPEPVSGEAVSAIAYTSGTTGFPKGLIVTRDSRYVQFLRWGWQFGVTADDVMLVGGPLFHLSFGGLAILALMTNARIRIMTSFDPDQACDEFQHRSTFAFLVPTMTAMVLDAWEARGRPPLDALRFMLSSGAPMPSSLLDRAMDAFSNATVAEAYGWTEGGWCTFEVKDRATLRPHSVGRPMVGSEVTIRDEDGRPLPVGEPGEITVRSILPFGGYLNRPDANETIAREGFIRSGDIGILDDDGRIRVVDRKNDMIVSGGENVYTAEVERVVVEHPSVAEVAVVGRPDERWGHLVVAVVVPTGPDLDVADLQAHCRLSLAGYKVPKDVVVVDELPKNAMGKVQKTRVRELVAQPTSATINS